MHMLMDVLMRLWGRQPEMLHQEFQCLEFVSPPSRHAGLFGKCLQIRMRNRPQVVQHILDANVHRLELSVLLRSNGPLHHNIC